MRELTLFLLTTIFTTAVHAGEPELEQVGAFSAILFSPDLADDGNRRFYEGLGFTYIETPDWHDALGQIGLLNASRLRVTTLIVESHGTNGNGLKLQDGTEPGDDRSYISVAALRDALDRRGVNVAILTACNAGRLYRPEIVATLDGKVADPLFLPATRGILNTSSPGATYQGIFRRVESNLETLLHVHAGELAMNTRTENGLAAETPIAISTLFLQLVLKDPDLRLTDTGWVSAKSRDEIPLARSEELLRELADHLSDGE